jgi:folate-binding protein YgfZ
MENYRGLNVSAGLIDRSERIRLSISGPDRAKFLHNLTTNEVKKLPVFQGREAFVTSLQGKTLGFITIHALKNTLIVRTDPAAADLIVPHFQKYGLFDEIQLENETGQTFEFHIAGPCAEQLFDVAFEQPLPSDELGLIEIECAAHRIQAIRESPTGRPGFTLVGPLHAKPDILGRLTAAGTDLELFEIDRETFDILRIEAGTPEFGRDLTEKNLPQELGRDGRAISFVKGCYLGQETVARIDALGHVNQMLRGFRLHSPEGRLAPGDVLRVDGKQVGHLTSTAFSPGWNSWVALGYLRESAKSLQDPITVVNSTGEESGQVIVVTLPMVPSQERGYS